MECMETHYNRQHRPQAFGQKRTFLYVPTGLFPSATVTSVSEREQQNESRIGDERTQCRYLL